MSTDDDPPESRIAALEATVDQLNERMGSVEIEIRRLREDLNDFRQENREWSSHEELCTEFERMQISIRNWALSVVLALSVYMLIVDLLVGLF